MRSLRLWVLISLLAAPCFADSEITVSGKTATPHIIQATGDSVRPRPYLNFTGNVNVTDSGGKTVVYIPGGSEADTLDTVSDRGATTNQLITTGGLTVSTDQNVGLGAGKGLIEFEDEATDNINLMNANVGVGTTAPESLLEVQGSEGLDSILTLDADDGDDSSDTWFAESDATTNDLYIRNHVTNLFTVQDGGNVGIGNTAPSAKLFIEQSNAADSLRVNDFSGDTTPFIIDQSGNVVVGATTATTSVELDVRNDIRAGNMYLWGTPPTGSDGQSLGGLRSEGTYSVGSLFANNGAFFGVNTTHINTRDDNQNGVLFSIATDGISPYRVIVYPAGGTVGYVTQRITGGLATGIGAGVSSALDATLPSILHIRGHNNSTPVARFSAKDSSQTADLSQWATQVAGASCSGYLTEEECTPDGCSWTEILGNCSDFNGNQETCNSTLGCTYPGDAGDCSAFNGDQGTCEGTSGCSWSDPDCTGNYDDGTCSGNYNNGTFSCTGNELTETVRTVIDADGDVGIGTSAPTTANGNVGRLATIHSTTNAALVLNTTTTTQSQGGVLEVGGGRGSGEKRIGQWNVRYLNSGSTDKTGEILMQINNNSSFVDAWKTIGVTGTAWTMFGSSSNPESVIHAKGIEGGDATFCLDSDEGDDNADLFCIEQDATTNDTYLKNHTTINVTIQDTGNVGIGTTSPANTLDVEGKVVIGATYSGTSACASTDGLCVEGSIGVGNTAPAAKLHVTGETRVTGVSGDGTGKVVCIKADGDFGTCSTVVDITGVCTCG